MVAKCQKKVENLAKQNKLYKIKESLKKLSEVKKRV